MKEAITDQTLGQSEEGFIRDLEVKNNLSSGTLVFYFNFFMMLKLHQNQSNDPSKKTNRKWSKSEIEFLYQYIKERQQEGALNITEILEECAQLLDRGYQSVNYKYYALLKQTEKKEDCEQKNSLLITSIDEKEVPVIATEVLHDPLQVPKVPQVPPVPQEKASQDEDLLDILSGLISNVQQLQGLNVTDLFRNLYQLTSLAVQNQAALQQMESKKSEINLEKEALREKLMKKEQQLMTERKRNDELQVEVAKLAKEINAFNQLGDAAKIQHLKAYNQRLNYIIDGFGIVLQVGS
jgi:hypothetical protein